MYQKLKSKYIYIKVINNINRFINKCNSYNIELFNIEYINDYIIVKINKEDYKKISRLNYYSNIEIYNYIGLDYYINKIKNNIYYIIIFIVCLITMYLVSNIIIDIRVIHSNKLIKELIINELYDNGIKKYSIKKNFDKLENIKNNILNNNKDKIEWISITNKGMKYIIRVEERIINDNNTLNNYCNIISNYNSIITSITSDKGDIIVNKNDYVRKGDVLISGDIILNDEVKNKVCASGIVKGIVWYKVNINIDRVYYKKVYTNKKRYNINILNKLLFKRKYTLYDNKYIINNKIFKIYKEIEYNNKEYKYTDKELLELSNKEIDNKFKTKLKNNYKILNKKILNKDINDNGINLEVYVSIEQIISNKKIM